MKYNIDIFKSESYQTILKVVLEFRHSCTGEKEHLLLEEAQIPSCLILASYQELNDAVGQVYTKHFSYNRSDIKYFFLTTSEFIRQETISIYDKDFYSKILGRAITICELWDVLCDIDIFPAGHVLYFGDFQAEYIKPKTYYLHEQPQNVIDKIAKKLNEK